MLFKVLADTEQVVQHLPTGDYGGAVVKMFLSLIALVALLFGSFWFLRRLIQQKLQKGGSSAAIKILEKRMISGKTMLYLVEIDKKKVLIAESHLEVRRIAEFMEKV